jgi:tripartite-type tricarboxylate transporter receptor subunit TctC
MKKHFLALCMLPLMAAAHTATAQEAPWPTKPVKFVVPYSPGGGIDLTARIVAQKLSALYGQQFIVENRAGGNTNIAAGVVAKAAPDGYTFLLPTPATLTVNPYLYEKLPYRVADFEPVALLGKFPLFVVVGSESKLHSVKELIAQAKASELAFASAGNGSMTHLGAELLKVHTGSKFLHVPYKGTAAAVTEVSVGRVDFMLADLGAAKGLIEAGKMRVLATTSAQRSSLLPSAPSMSDEGISGVDVTTWIGVAAPKGTPKTIVNRLSSQIARILAEPEVKDRFAQAGLEPTPLSPEAFETMIAKEGEKWKTVIQTSHLKPD